MDMFGSLSTLECFHVDDLLDFSNDVDDFAATSSISSADSQHPPPQNPFQHHQSSNDPFFDNYPFASYTEFTASLSILSDDAADLEWLSQFIGDSFNDFPTNTVSGSALLRSDTTFPSKTRSKRSKASISTSSGAGAPVTRKSSRKTKSTATAGTGVRRCTHCASEKTPQWRTGPLGPKTLCNACGVRYKSGRLVPEYRPAASPTFALTQHSNSHRKVMELRRQKELLKQRRRQPEQC